MLGQHCIAVMGGGPRVVVSTAAFHPSVRGSVPGLGGLKEAKMFLPHSRVKVSIVGSLRDREVACSASDRQGSNFESCVWRTVSSQSSHHPQEILLAHFSLYVHKGGLHFICITYTKCFVFIGIWEWYFWQKPHPMAEGSYVYHYMSGAVTRSHSFICSELCRNNYYTAPNNR